MKLKALHPRNLLLRCLAMKRDGYWVAICIDLDLTAQADTLAQVRKALNGQIASYVADAVGVDVDHASYLLRRRAPLRYFALYHFIKLVHVTKSKRTYESPLPMVPVGA